MDIADSGLEVCCIHLPRYRAQWVALDQGPVTLAFSVKPDAGGPPPPRPLGLVAPIWVVVVVVVDNFVRRNKEKDGQDDGRGHTDYATDYAGYCQALAVGCPGVASLHTNRA